MGRYGADLTFLRPFSFFRRAGLYYLSAGTYYATAANVYGPYTFRGSTGPGRKVRDFGLTNQAHGRFFTWHAQWFHAYCEFIDENNTRAEAEPAGIAERVFTVPENNTRKYRDSWMTYTHFRANGEMVDDVGFLDQDSGRLGVGQYDARWPRIEAEWFMKAASTHPTSADAAAPETVELNCSRPSTNSSAAQFGARFPPVAVAALHRPYLAFPNVHHLPSNATGGRFMSVGVTACPSGAAIELHRSSSPGGAVLLAAFTCKMPGAFTATFDYSGSSADDDLMLVYSSGAANGSLVLDWFNLTLAPPP